MKPINEEVPEPKSPCPFCKEQVPDYNDDCPRCLNYIPFCIASGKYFFIDLDMWWLRTWGNAKTANSIATSVQWRGCWTTQKLKRIVLCATMIFPSMTSSFWEILESQAWKEHLHPRKNRRSDQSNHINHFKKLVIKLFGFSSPFFRFSWKFP